MRTLILSALLLSSSMSAMTLGEIINSSLAKSPSLESINARIAANKQAIDAANQFSNPEMSLTKNTLDSSQRMSKTVFSIKQNIPYYSKRDSRQKVSIADDAILNEKLNAAKVKLVAKIKIEAYKVWELRELYKIIDKYISLTEGNIELYESYTSVSNDSQHMGIMKAKLSLSDLEIQKSTLNSKIYSAMARLSYLAAFDIKSLEINLSVKNKPSFNQLKNSLVNNPDIAIKTKEIVKENAKVNLADINNYPDFNWHRRHKRRRSSGNGLVC